MGERSQPTTLALTGADCFLRAFDAEVRRYNGASHLSQLVLRLAPGFSQEHFEQVLKEVSSANPIVRAPIRRSLARAPVYRLDRAGELPPVEFRDASESRSELPEIFFQRLNGLQRGERGELLRFDGLHYPDGRTDLAMTWLHMLFDGSGSEAFIQLLAECARGERAPTELGSEELAPAGLAKSLRGRGNQARAWQDHLESLAAAPPSSLAGPLRVEPQDLLYSLDAHAADESLAIRERANQKAGFMTPMLFYLAIALRAHHAVFEARGRVPASYVVPLPVNLRPKGAAPAVFRTRVSMLWFQVLPELVRDLDELIEDLKKQRREMIRADQVSGGLAAMEFARFAPRRLYGRMARRTFGGELCSFFFAYTDDFLPDLDEFLGASIENGFHAPSVPASPGSSLIMSLRGGCLNVTHVRQAGLFSDDELALFRNRLAADLSGSE